MKKVKEKKERALGEHLHLKGERCLSPKCAVVRRPYRPGVHGHKRQRPISEFGRQIREKQKVKLTYGLGEGELRRLFNTAKKEKSSTTQVLLQLLERRLDNIVFRMGLASSRRAGRQLVVQGHIFVNNKRVRSPGYLVSPSNHIRFREESHSKGQYTKLAETLKNVEPPEWIRVDSAKKEGEVLSAPIVDNHPFDISVVIESFSK